MPSQGISALAAGLCILGNVLAETPSQAQSSTLSLDELVAAADQARSSKPRDQFDTPPAGPNWQGRKFSYLVIPEGLAPGGGPTCSGYPSWSFVNGNLNVGARAEFVISYQLLRSDGALIPGLGDASKDQQLWLHSIACERRDESTYAAQNAFGAKATVASWTERLIAVAETGGPDLKFRTYWNKPMSGDEARRLTRDLRVRVSGTLGTWPGGQAVVCGTTTHTPRLNNPTDKTIDGCIFRGKIEVVEFIDTGTGEILYSATRKKK